jgi:hypothetical protein
MPVENILTLPWTSSFWRAVLQSSRAMGRHGDGKTSFADL